MNTAQIAWPVQFLLASYALFAVPKVWTGSVLPADLDFAHVSYSENATVEAQNKRVYRIVMLGDSMTASLGPHGGILAEQLNQRYQNHDILIDNYSQGSQNILQAVEKLDEPMSIYEYNFEALTKRPFDVVMIESFGYNPLSDKGLKEGLVAHTQALDTIISAVTQAQPHAQIVFLATIAPDKNNYARGAANLTNKESQQQAEERAAYIENHIEYAKTHNIPLINVYDKSRSFTGNGRAEFIDPGDNIHPSAAGVELITKEITDYIYSRQILED